MALDTRKFVPCLQGFCDFKKVTAMSSSMKSILPVFPCNDVPMLFLQFVFIVIRDFEKREVFGLFNDLQMQGVPLFSVGGPADGSVSVGDVRAGACQNESGVADHSPQRWMGAFAEAGPGPANNTSFCGRQF